MHVDSFHALVKYRELMAKHLRGTIGDAADLPCPKSVMKKIILEFVGRGSPGLDKKYDQAYVALADFQEKLTSEEKHAAAVMRQVVIAQFCGAPLPIITVEVAT